MTIAFIISIIEHGELFKLCFALFLGVLIAQADHWVYAPEEANGVVKGRVFFMR